MKQSKSKIKGIIEAKKNGITKTTWKDKNNKNKTYVRFDYEGKPKANLKNKLGMKQENLTGNNPLHSVREVGRKIIELNPKRKLRR